MSEPSVRIVWWLPFFSYKIDIDGKQLVGIGDLDWACWVWGEPYSYSITCYIVVLPVT